MSCNEGQSGLQGSASNVTSLANSNLTAQFSEQMAMAAMPILAVVSLSATAPQAAFLQAINSLPFLFLSIPAGLLADRYHRKSLMIGAELIRAAALFLLFFLFFAKLLTINTLSVFGFIIATGTVMYSVAAPALVGALVKQEYLLIANRRLEIARSIAFTAGPSLGGILAGWASGMFAFLAAFLLSVVSVFFLTRLPAEPPRNIIQHHVFRELGDGVRFVFGSQYLRSIVLTSVVFNTSWFLFLAVFAYYAVYHLSFTEFEVGAALGVFGAGMMVGSFSYKFVAARFKLGKQIILGPICAFISSLMIVGSVFLPSKTLVFVAFFLYGVGPIVWTISTTALRQVVTPLGLLARVSSFIMTVTYGARPIGAALGAWLSARYGVESVMYAAAIGFMTQALIILFSYPAKLLAMDEVVQESMNSSLNN